MEHVAAWQQVPAFYLCERLAEVDESESDECAFVYAESEQEAIAVFRAYLKKAFGYDLRKVTSDHIRVPYAPASYEDWQAYFDMREQALLNCPG